jgi:hypothetical protein
MSPSQSAACDGAGLQTDFEIVTFARTRRFILSKCSDLSATPQTKHEEIDKAENAYKLAEKPEPSTNAKSNLFAGEELQVKFLQNSEENSLNY